METECLRNVVQPSWDLQFHYLLNITCLNLAWRISSKLLHFTSLWRRRSVYSSSEHCVLNCRTVFPPECTSPSKLCSFFLPGVSAVWRWSKTRKALSSEIRNLPHMRDKFNDRLPRAGWKVAYAVRHQWRAGKALCVGIVWECTECHYTNPIKLTDQQICQSCDWKLLLSKRTLKGGTVLCAWDVNNPS
jgi:hypothetical protein